jgi:hypothetical protein
MGIPLWARLLLRATRATLKLHRAQEILRDELLFAYLPASERAEFTIQSYEPEHIYAPGGAVFEMGLFEWEKALLESSLLPATGRVLLGAAGGGRELKGLAERGYTVSAFEPAQALLSGAQQVAGRFPGCQVLRGTYADLCELVESPSGELAALDLHVDLVWLGYGSLSHLIGPGEPLRLLRSVSRLAPEKLVVLSYVERGSEAAKGRGARRLREALRRTFHALGGLEVPEGLECHTLGGFCYTFTPDEVTELARQAGYRILLHRSEPFPHAVLAPATAC